MGMKVLQIVAVAALVALAQGTRWAEKSPCKSARRKRQSMMQPDGSVQRHQNVTLPDHAPDGVRQFASLPRGNPDALMTFEEYDAKENRATKWRFKNEKLAERRRKRENLRLYKARIASRVYKPAQVVLDTKDKTRAYCMRKESVVRPSETNMFKALLDLEDGL